MTAAHTKPAVDDRLALLQRGRKGRAVKRTDAHLETVDPVNLDDIPDPYDARGEASLDEAERTDLATCEQAVAGLAHALAAAGKALATIHQARLYRETHPSFEAYVEDRWDMQRAHAYRLLDAWPVAAALSPNGRQTLNERQARELVKVAKQHGLPAAVALYEGAANLGGRVTAARLEQARRALPARLAAPDQARDIVQVAAAEGRITMPTSRAPSAVEDQEQDESEIVDAEIVGEGGRAVAVLASVADRQRRLYDEIGGGVISDALVAEPARAEGLLREITQYANRTAYRARQNRPGEE